MNRTWTHTLAALTAIALIVGPASIVLAQATTQPAGGAPQECDRASLTGQTYEQFIKDSKQPTDWLKWGADARLRDIFAPNLLSNKEDRHFQRYRFRIWATVQPTDDIDVNARYVWEPRHFCQPSRVAYARNARIIDEWTLNEAIVDKANVQWSNILGSPLTVKAGRQDIILGNGWLVLDGTPLDGSRTIFFDAIRATWNAEDMKTKFDLIYICQQADSDQRIPPACDKDFHNMEQDEQGAILYVTNTSMPNTQIDGYFIYKHDERVLKLGDRGIAPWQTGTNADIYTWGARVAGDLGDCWKYRAEFAQQFGHRSAIDGMDPSQSLCAFGFNSRLSYFTKDQWNNNFRVSYEYLSGDKDSSDSTNEQFDQLWGRWPQWSELYVYTVALESRPGEVTNLHRISAGWSCNPAKELELCADAHFLFTDKNNTSDRTIGGDRVFSDSGCYRGTILAGLLRYNFTEHISGHLLAELFMPGDYYNDNFNEVAGFFRYELTFTW